MGPHLHLPIGVGAGEHGGAESPAPGHRWKIPTWPDNPSWAWSGVWLPVAEGPNPDLFPWPAEGGASPWAYGTRQ
jgi:hypothetical protein